MRQAYSALGVESFVVGPAMRKHPDHPLQGFRSDGRSVEIEHSSYTAHKVLTQKTPSNDESGARENFLKSHSC